MNSEILLTEQHPNGISVLTFNRPERHNAFDDHFIKLLTQQLNILQNDSNVKVIILNANGKNFSAGADLDWMKKMINYSEKENFDDAMQLVTLLKTLNRMTKPTISLAKGVTMGGGCRIIMLLRYRTCT